MGLPTLQKGVSAIEKHGILLVFPINNKKEPHSLWSDFYPKTKMRWEWDDSASNNVVHLWHLREQLARSKKVVYTKWYQGRATFFSKEVFVAWLQKLHQGNLTSSYNRLSRDAQMVLQLLEEDSPQSSKALKKTMRKEHGVEGKMCDKLLKELWEGLFIVGVGEVDDGAFPSLDIGATSVLFEKLWEEGTRSAFGGGEALSLRVPLFYRFLVKLRGKTKPKTKLKGSYTFEELSTKSKKR